MEHHHLADFAFPNGRFGAELSNGIPYYIYPNMVRGFSGLELDLEYHGGYRKPDIFTPDKLNYDPSAATRLDERRGTPVHHLATDRWVNPKQIIIDTPCRFRLYQRHRRDDTGVTLTSLV